MTEDELLDYEHLLPLDRYILHCLALHCKQVVELYEEFYFNKVVLKTQFFVASTLSAFYFSLVKDRLYCDLMESQERKSANTVMFYVLKNLQASISPILPILCREVFLHSSIQQNPTDASTFLYQYISTDRWIDERLKNETELLIGLKETIRQNIVGSSETVNEISSKDLNKLELLIIPLCNDTVSALSKFGTSGIKELFQVSQVQIFYSESELYKNVALLDMEPYIKIKENNFIIYIITSKHKMCPRCRLYSCSRLDDEDTLCDRCQHVIKKTEIVL